MRHPLSFGLVAAALLASGCLYGMEEVKLSRTAPVITAAQGAVKTARAGNDTIRLIVRVKHLAPPGRVQAGATAYVVWTQAAGSHEVHNVGTLDIDEKLKDSLMAYVPHDRFKVFITAEPSEHVSRPSGDELLSANVDESD